MITQFLWAEPPTLDPEEIEDEPAILHPDGPLKELIDSGRYRWDADRQCWVRVSP